MYIFIYFFYFFHFLLPHLFPLFQGRGRNRADLDEERRKKAMPRPPKTWKKAELAVAGLLGGRRCHFEGSDVGSGVL